MQTVTKNFTIQDFFGYHPHEFQKEFHRRRALTQFLTLVAHRRYGKTEGAIMELLVGAMQCKRRLPIYEYLAPTLKQAKQIAWDKVKYYTHKAKDNGLTGVDVSETDAKVIFKHRSDPAIVRLAGWEEPESLRGPYTDGMVLDETADLKEGVWGTVLSPKLADRKGWAVFTGTVKGINALFDFWRKGVPGKGKDPLWDSLYYPESVTHGKIPWLDDYAIAMLKSAMTTIQWRQEMECDWNASSENVLIVLDAIMKATERNLQENEYRHAAHVMGLDVARFGEDSSVFLRRQGLATFPLRRFEQRDTTFLAGQANREIRQYGLDSVFVDGTGGFGAGVVDALRQMNPPCPIFEVAFNGKATDQEHYYNHRAEMWDGISKWLSRGGSLVRDESLIRDLASPQYGFEGGRMKLESKDEIRKRLGKSPDAGDALALTFAYPVLPMEKSFNQEGFRTISVRDDFKLGL